MNFTSPSTNSKAPLTLAQLEHWLMVDFWTEHGDPRVPQLFFFGSYRPALIILTLYLIFVLYLGPKLMANRKPYSLKPLLLVYNIAMASFNCFIFFRAFFVFPHETFTRMWNTKFPNLTDNSEMSSIIIWHCHLYILSKFIDLFDTIFFVLRKKYSQITALHLYHHTSVAGLGWVTFRLCATCNVGAPFLVMNSFLHTSMYSYYALAALGPQMQPYLWWKRYLTQLQITQFVVLFLHAVYFIATQVGYSRYYTYNYIFNTIVYLVLFTRFYLQSYKKRKSKLSPPETTKQLYNKIKNY